MNHEPTQPDPPEPTEPPEPPESPDTPLTPGRQAVADQLASLAAPHRDPLGGEAAFQARLRSAVLAGGCDASATGADADHKPHDAPQRDAYGTGAHETSTGKWLFASGGGASGGGGRLAAMLVIGVVLGATCSQFWHSTWHSSSSAGEAGEVPTASPSGTVASSGTNPPPGLEGPSGGGASAPGSGSATAFAAPGSGSSGATSGGGASGGTTSGGGVLPSKESVRMHLAAFREMSAFLDHRAAWLALSPQTQDVGISDQPLVNPAFLAQIRVTAWRGDECVGSTDVMLAPDEPARLTVPIEGGRQVEYVLIASSAVRPTLSLAVRIQDNQRPNQAAAIGTVVELHDQGVIPAGQVRLDDTVYRLVLGYAIVRSPGIVQ